MTAGTSANWRSGRGRADAPAEPRPEARSPPTRSPIDSIIVTSDVALRMAIGFRGVHGRAAMLPGPLVRGRDCYRPADDPTTSARSARRGIRLLPSLHRLLGREGREQVHQAGDDPRPAGLVAGPEPGAVVAVEILVEQEAVAPVRVLLEGRVAAEDRAAAVRVPAGTARTAAARSPRPPGTGSSAGRTRWGIRR